MNVFGRIYLDSRFRYTTDGTIALFIGALPLVLPDRNPFRSNWEYQPILPWNHLSKTFPWGVFMLQGAGLAIADGFKVTILSSLVEFLLNSTRHRIYPVLWRPFFDL